MYPGGLLSGSLASIGSTRRWQLGIEQPGSTVSAYEARLFSQ
jgi:hypothetical protein